MIGGRLEFYRGHSESETTVAKEKEITGKISLEYRREDLCGSALGRAIGKFELTRSQIVVTEADVLDGPYAFAGSVVFSRGTGRRVNRSSSFRGWMLADGWEESISAAFLTSRLESKSIDVEGDADEELGQEEY